MGTDFRTFAVRGGDPQATRDAIVGWLRAKGFEPRSERRLFPLTDDERGLAVTRCNGWTVLAYSHDLEEADRLLFELQKLPSKVLEFWVRDSSVWGYRLHVGRDLVAAYNAWPGYDSTPIAPELPQNGDPERLCRELELGVNPRVLAKRQRGWAIFQEHSLARFCVALGVEPAAYEFDTLQSLGIAAGEHVTAGGVPVECLYLTRRGLAGRNNGPRLHDAIVRPPRPQSPDPAMEAWQIAMHQQLQPLVRCLQVVSWLLRPIVWCVTTLFVLRQGLARARRTNEREWHRQLESIGRPEQVTAEGDRLVNHTHRCSLVVPEPLRIPFTPSAYQVFAFELEGVRVNCTAFHPGQMRMCLHLWVGAEILADERHHADCWAARCIHITSPYDAQSRHLVWDVVETPQALYRFDARAAELGDSFRAALKTMIESFRMVDEPSAPEAAVRES